MFPVAPIFLVAFSSIGWSIFFYLFRIFGPNTIDVEEVWQSLFLPPHSSRLPPDLLYS